MNTILRSKMEREIKGDWAFRTHDDGDALFANFEDHKIWGFWQNNTDSVPSRGWVTRQSVSHVRPPGGEWLEVVDDPKVGSVWEHDGGYRVVTSYGDEVEYTFYGTNGEQWNATLHCEAFVNECKPVDSSRIIEGMDAGRRRRFFITNEFRKARQGEYWLRRSGPQKGEVEREDCRECALAGDILIPLDFVNEQK